MSARRSGAFDSVCPLVLTCFFLSPSHQARFSLAQPPNHLAARLPSSPGQRRLRLRAPRWPVVPRRQRMVVRPPPRAAAASRLVCRTTVTARWRSTMCSATAGCPTSGTCTTSPSSSERTRVRLGREDERGGRPLARARDWKLNAAALVSPSSSSSSTRPARSADHQVRRPRHLALVRPEDERGQREGTACE